MSRLSDSLERKINVGITRAYRTTTVMDHRPEQMRQALSLYLLGREDASDDDLAAVADRLATARGDKFKHHILLRYVSGAGRDDPLRKAYRAARERWLPFESCHPWELIEFYRALLVAPGVERMSHFEARARPEDSGPGRMRASQGARRPARGQAAAARTRGKGAAVQFQVVNARGKGERPYGKLCV